MMFIILLLIVAVAAFNIVSTLVMAVTDKQADIAILRTLGASPGSIMAIFIVQGALIGVVGLAAGVAGGVALALNIDVVVPAHRAPAGRAVPRQGRVLHQRPALRPALVRCRHHRRGVLRADAAGDAVSELARLARQAGGGAAL
jgi:hypothetical protein